MEKVIKINFSECEIRLPDGLIYKAQYYFNEPHVGYEIFIKDGGDIYFTRTDSVKRNVSYVGAVKIVDKSQYDKIEIIND